MSNLSIILISGKESYLITKPSTFELALLRAQELFPTILYPRLIIEVKTRKVALTPESWSTSQRMLTDEVEVFVESGSGLKRKKCDNDSEDEKEEVKVEVEAVEVEAIIEAKKPKIEELEGDPSTLKAISPIGLLERVDDAISLRFQMLGRLDSFTVRCSLRTSTKKIYNIVADRLNVKVEDFLVTYDETTLQRGDYTRLYHYDISAEDCDENGFVNLEVRMMQKGGKPVIYLFPPTLLSSVKVKLSLVPEWNFSALYPVAPITKTNDGVTSTEWIVSATPSGDLIELSSSLELNYLFWEAITTSVLRLPPSPPLLPIDFNQHSSSASTSNSNSIKFNPNQPNFNSSNTIVLPFNQFIPYLDSTLKKLSLHTSARNDFITYWLPNFNHIQERGQKIAMRFVNQIEYEHSAKLEISPQVPDIISRIFMLFSGINDDQMGWENRRENVEEFDWVKIVGIKEEAWDSSLFRVLEWGGMEVFSSCVV